MSIIVKEVLANGRLTTRNENPAIASRRRILDRVVARLGITLDALALAAALAQPWADIVLSGAMNVEQLRSNLTALRVPWNSTIDADLAPLAWLPAAYWSERESLRVT